MEKNLDRLLSVLSNVHAKIQNFVPNGNSREYSKKTLNQRVDHLARSSLEFVEAHNQDPIVVNY